MTIGDSIFGLTNQLVRYQNTFIRPSLLRDTATIRMRLIRLAIIAVFLLVVGFQASAMAAHCRSGDRLVTGEWSDQVAPGVFDPHRPSWEIEASPSAPVWGMSCQGDDSSKATSSPSVTFIITAWSIVRMEVPAGVRRPLIRDDCMGFSLRWPPEPKPPKTCAAGV